MRLREIARILEENLENISNYDVVNSNGGNYKIHNFTNIRRTVNRIKKTGIFKDLISSLEKTEAFSSTLDSIIVSQSDYSNINGLLAALKNSGEELLNSIDNALPKSDSEDLISIKLPDNLDFDSLGRVIDLLKKALSLPLNDSEINDNIEIAGFESGSFWIDILVHSKEAVALIAAITWAGAYIYRQSLEGKKHIQYIESLKIKNDHLKDIQEASKKQLEILIEAEAQNLQNQHYNGNEPERLKRLELSIESMSALIEKGTEIHPSLLAFDNTSSMFPSFKNLNLIESKTKQISKE